MKKNLLISLLFVKLIFSVTSTNASEVDELKLCEIMAISAIEEFVKINRPPNSNVIAVFIAAQNDLLYDTSECMANFLIYAISDSGNFYGIFHIHYTISGEWIKTAEISEKDWKISYSKNDRKDYWCNFINSVYPDEMKKQGCE